MREADEPSLGCCLYDRLNLIPQEYRGTSLIRKFHPLGPCSRHMRRALWRSWGGGGSYERGTPVLRARCAGGVIVRGVLELETGTSLIRNFFLLGPYSRPMPRSLWETDQRLPL